MDEVMPAGLKHRGESLWKAVTDGRSLDVAQKVLLLNACRITDRLDDLDAEIGGRLISYNARGDEVINPLISEHRQQYATLSGIFSKMGFGELPKAAAGDSKWDELAARRAKRNPKAS